MATINYLYRSIKTEGFLTLRLLYRLDNKDHQIDGKTETRVPKQYWKKTHYKKRINDPELSNYRNELNSEHLDPLRQFVLDAFFKTNIEEVNKNWLKTIIKKYYHPDLKKKAPTTLLKYFEYYIKQKENDLSKRRKQRIRLIKRKLGRFEDNTGKKLEFLDVNENFKNEFIKYSDQQSYSRTTQNADLTVLKTICYYARKKGKKLHPELDDLRIKADQTEAIYLNPEELEKIKNLKLNDRLNNARDWLLISCYTGQRISDFMRFNREMIRVEDNRYYLDFEQQKTKKLMSIPFGKKARRIFDKRDGHFPRAISHQRYNNYIKEVCETAGINEKIHGKIKMSIAKKNKAKKRNYRGIPGNYEKWRLVSSHIGRRTFATNNYGKIPTTYLIYITGHSTETQFLKYIRKSNRDLAKDAYKYFE